MLDRGEETEAKCGHNAPRPAKHIPLQAPAPKTAPGAVTSAQGTQPAAPPTASGSHSARAAVGHVEDGSIWSLWPGFQVGREELGPVSPLDGFHPIRDGGLFGDSVRLGLKPGSGLCQAREVERKLREGLPYPHGSCFALKQLDIHHL